MRLVNLTGHSLKLTDGRGIVVIPSEGRARVVSESHLLNLVDVEHLDSQLRVTKLEYSKIVGLPDAEEDTLFIVSGLVASHCPDRLDVVAPGQLEREQGTGRVIGCRGFIKPASVERLAS